MDVADGELAAAGEAIPVDVGDRPTVDGSASAWNEAALAVPLAPLVSVESLEKVPMEQVEAGPVDYVVKCTQGVFAGRFIYLNRTSQGELFGSDRTCKDITMYIENADLAPQHAQIQFSGETYQYFLRDVASTSGTWMRVRWNRSVEVAPGQELRIGDVLLSICEGRQIASAEEASRWLSLYSLQSLAPRLEANGIRTVEDIRAHGCRLLELAGDLSVEETATFTNALHDIDKMFPAGVYPTSGISLVLRGGGEDTQVASVAWEGGYLALAPNGALEAGDFPEEEAARDITVGHVDVHGAGWETCEWLRLGYSFGRYYVHLSEKSAESSQKVWVRLRDGQRHWLQPRDVFRIGSLEFEVLRFNAGVCSEQGARASMEDEEILLQDLATSNWRNCSFFGIYDGHGGRECVSFVRSRLHMNFVSALHAKGGLDKSTHVHQDIFESLVKGFRETDQQFLSLSLDQKGSGCVAVVVCVVGSWIWCANAGDCRALLCRDGQAIQLSLDHKPDREDEAARIEAAGGFVSFRRVLGRLAVSRAFGDEEYKVVSEQNPLMKHSLVIPDPEIRVERITNQDEFLFLACDGLFDVFTSQEAVDFIRGRLAQMPWGEQDPDRVVQEIVHEAIHSRRTRDNVTALLITFKRSVGPQR